MSAEKLLEYRFPAVSEQLQRVRDLIRQAYQGLDCSSEFVNATVLAVDEACTNVIRHAYGHSGPGEMLLEMERDGDRLTFRLTDFAPTSDKSLVCSRCIDEVQPGGLGVHLINTIMDSVEFRDPPGGHGNVLEMSKRLENGNN